MAESSVRVVEIEFLYLDVSSCSRCVASDATIRKAIGLLEPALGETGVILRLRPVQVTTAAQAVGVRLVTSPTIRVDGVDIAVELVETECGDCTDLSASAGPVGCRVWHYRGLQYVEPPVGLIIDAVLAHLYRQPASPRAQDTYPGLPENLRQFFGPDS